MKNINYPFLKTGIALVAYNKCTRKGAWFSGLMVGAVVRSVLRDYPVKESISFKARSYGFIRRFINMT